MFEVAQGMYRLRNLNYGHMLDYFTNSPNADTLESFHQAIEEVGKKSLEDKRNLMMYQCMQTLSRNRPNRSLKQLEHVYNIDVFYDLINFDEDPITFRSGVIKQLLFDYKLISDETIRKYCDYDTSSSHLSISQQINIAVALNYQVQIKGFGIQLARDCSIVQYTTKNMFFG